MHEGVLLPAVRAEDETARNISFCFLLRMTEMECNGQRRHGRKEQALAFRAHEKPEIIEVDLIRRNRREPFL
jgi:hypothetical protein